MKRLLLLILLVLSMLIVFGFSSSASKHPYEFKTWKTIELGRYRSGQGLLKALKNKFFNIETGDYRVFDSIIVAKYPTKIELVLVTGTDLGFTEDAPLDAIYDRAKELGLDLVPAEVGPQLRLAYTDQPLNEWMVMAMEPIMVSDGDLDVFSVGRHDGGRWLDSYYGNPGDMWSPDYRWVFARRKHN